jgi:hypothetical protein
LWQAKLDEGTSAPESPAQTPKEKMTPEPKVTKKPKLEKKGTSEGGGPENAAEEGGHPQLVR